EAIDARPVVAVVAGRIDAAGLEAVRPLLVLHVGLLPADLATDEERPLGVAPAAAPRPTPLTRPQRHFHHAALLVLAHAHFHLVAGLKRRECGAKGHLVGDLFAVDGGDDFAFGESGLGGGTVGGHHFDFDTALGRRDLHAEDRRGVLRRRSVFL